MHREIGYNGIPFESAPKNKPLGFDTETELIQSNAHIPRMVLGILSDGQRTVIFPSSDLQAILKDHMEHHFVFHNCAFDFHVIEKELRRQKANISLIEWWYEIHEKGRVHDTMLLDMLITLAKDPVKKNVDIPEGDQSYSSGVLRRRNLKQVAKSYRWKGGDLNKDDPFRTRYGELLSIPEDQWEKEADPGFWEYAEKDGRAVADIYPKMYVKALKLQQPYVSKKSDKTRSCYHDCIKRFGVLTERVQVLGAISLAAATKNGMPYDYEASVKARQHYSNEMHENLMWLSENAKGLFRRKRHKRFFRDKKSGLIRGTDVFTEINEQKCLPKINQKVLRHYLKRAADELGIQPVLSGKTKEISAAYEYWADHMAHHPFLRNYYGVAKVQKLLDVFTHFTKEQSRIHPGYNPLVSTGRVSCFAPNLQQVPAIGLIRSIFKAPPGKQLITIDFSAIEMRTLAVVCMNQLGESKLAEIFSNDPPKDDPHSYTISVNKGLDFEDFLSWGSSEDYIEVDNIKGPKNKVRKTLRALAKVYNFGIGGGLGWRNLKNLAHLAGVELTDEEAEAFRTKLITKVYPELSLYLSDVTLPNMAEALGVPSDLILERLSDYGPTQMMLFCLTKVISGFPFKADGTPYQESFVNRIWYLIADLVAMGDEEKLGPWVKYQVRAHKGGLFLKKALITGTACTLTGRVRKGLGYSQMKNTPFQGLAADGAKLAMWRLVREGFKLVGFVHDEMIVEVSKEKASEEADQVQQIIEEEMSKVLNHLVPVRSEYRVSQCWEK